MANRRIATGSSSSTIRSRNLSAVLRIMLQHKYISRVRLAQLTHLSTTTITNLITELLEQGIVTEAGSDDNHQPQSRRRKVGRPKTPLSLIPESRYVIGVHIGVGSVRIAAVNLLGQPLKVYTLDHPIDRPAQEVLAEIARIAQTAAAEVGIESEKVLGVGVGASGLVDPATGLNVFAPNLGWRNVPVQDDLAGHLKLPVCVDNNVRAMALGEALFGMGQDVRSLAFVYVRVGVGAGFVVDGQLYHGGGAGAGEVGHMTVIPEGGATCRCGNTGCLETLVSEPIIVQLAQSLTGGETLAIEQIFEAARRGNDTILEMLEARARYMGITLANLVNVLNPDLVVMGGIFAQGNDLLFPVVQATMQQRAFAGLGEGVQLRTPSFGEDAGVIGAAALALNAFFYNESQE